MQSPNATSRFTLLPTAYLASQPPSSEITLQSLIDTSDRMAEEAREALPYSFDECTYDKGYLRQSVWSCLDCGEKGVCYGCSISCHSEHRLVELWTRRHFRCDCPTTPTQPEPSSASTSANTTNSTSQSASTSQNPRVKRRKCTLYPPEKQPQAFNEENSYTQTFQGKFCRCGREYDAETETEAMICCIACEDWFHESCLNLRPASSSSNASGPNRSEGKDNGINGPSASAEPAISTAAADELEEEDEESAVLIRSESYDGLICAACVNGNEYLRSRAGEAGWMIIEPSSSEGAWEVLGRPNDGDGPVEKKEKKAQAGNIDGTPDINVNGKRTLGEEVAEEDEQSGKKVKLDSGSIVMAPQLEGDHDQAAGSAPVTTAAQTNDTAETSEREAEWKWKGKGDIFLANGIRDQLKFTLDEKTISSLPFPLEDEEIYEPPKDDDREETMDEVTSRVMGQLPRVQAIEALHGYQRLKDRLNDMLRSHVESGESVSREDIEGLFEQLKGQRS
ncbi:hypothetical protein IAT40_007094 [Kwoniella sp. CBS 6097]